MADFVSVHTRWCHRNTYLRKTAPGKKCTVVCFPTGVLQDCLFTSNLGARSVVDRSWERPATEAAQVPSGKKTTLIPSATAPQPPELTHFTPQPSTRYGTNTTEKGMQPWAAYGQNCGGLHGQCIVHCEQKVFTCFSSHLLCDGALTQWQWKLIEPNPQIFYSNNWGGHLTPYRTVTDKGKRRGLAQYPVQTLVTTRPITPPIKRITAQSEERHGRYP